MPGNSNRAAADTSGSCQRSPSRTTPPATRPCPLRRRAKKALRWVRNPTQGPSLRPWEENVGVGIILANALGRRGDGRHIPNKRPAKGAPSIKEVVQTKGPTQSLATARPIRPTATYNRRLCRCIDGTGLFR